MDIITKAIVYPFKDKKWSEKYLIIVAIVFASLIISTVVSFVVTLPLQMFSAIADFVSSSAQNASSTGSTISSITSSFSSMFVSIITLPMIFYFLGYFTKLIKGMINEEKDFIPAHKDIFQKISQGALLYLLQIIISFPIGIVAMIVMGAGGVGIFVLARLISNSPMYIALLVLVIVILFAVFIAIAIASILIKLSSAYIFISTSDFGKALNIKKIFELITKYWKEFANIYGYFLLFGFLTIPAFFISIFTAFLGVPVITTSYYFAIAYTIGVYFKKIKEKE
ncbi:DUF4013 domain-containing protein [Candidatus Dojkabacteria bacterium]|jgi:hypothetical protein|nr:DUF4013 domain-containing protein [Candidatus Dojkabacteria bacterium]